MHSGFVQQFGSAVREGLHGPGQKWLPCQYLYDAVGSALFDAICRLPEYGLSRAGDRLMRRHSGELAERLVGPLCIVELGSGSGLRTAGLLSSLTALRRHQTMRYAPVDICESALEQCVRQVTPIDGLQVTPLAADFLDGLQRLVPSRSEHERWLVLFLGSTLGNFSRADARQFLRRLRATLRPGDALLLGADLNQSEAQLRAAYDDPTGVTAAFNRNILAHINRALDADFPVADFVHEVRWDSTEERIEMHLRSPRPVRVEVRDAPLTVQITTDETIWTESCHKFTLPGLTRMAHDAGFTPDARWVDETWPCSHEFWSVPA